MGIECHRRTDGWPPGGWIANGDGKKRLIGVLTSSRIRQVAEGTVRVSAMVAPLPRYVKAIGNAAGHASTAAAPSRTPPR